MNDLFQSSCPCCGRPYETDVAVSGFDDFWAAHPGARQNKKAAQEKFAKAVKSGAKPAEIVAAARAYANHCRQVNKPPRLPVTWLNQRGWEDDHQQTQAKAISAQQPAKGNTNGRLSADERTAIRKRVAARFAGMDSGEDRDVAGPLFPARTIGGSR